MNTNIEIKNLESQVIECYSYFMNNYQNKHSLLLKNVVGMKLIVNFRFIQK